LLDGPKAASQEIRCQQVMVPHPGDFDPGALAARLIAARNGSDSE
jgi:hypothetical protein